MNDVGIEVDATDMRILAALQLNGRATAESIAKSAHLSARATLSRIRALETSGVIRGYWVDLNPHATANRLSIFAEVALRDQRRQTATAFEARVTACEEVVACYLVSGRFDYLVRFCCLDIDHYQELTNAWLDDVSLCIERIVTSTEMKAIKEYRGRPMRCAGAPGPASSGE